MITGRISPPTVIGNDTHQLCPVADKLCKIFSINRFIADCRSISNSSRSCENLAYIANSNLSGNSAQVGHQPIELFDPPIVGHHLDSDHQFGLMMNSHITTAVDRQCTVKNIIPQHTIATGRVGCSGSIGILFESRGSANSCCLGILFCQQSPYCPHLR